MTSTKENIAKIYLKNVGIRGVAELLGIASGTVINEIKKYKDYRLTFRYKPDQEYEIDEMQTYVKDKKCKRWIAYAIEKSSRAVISVAVGRRTNATLRKIVNSVLSLHPKRIYTDGLKNYKSLVPVHLHRIQKIKLQLIERKT